MPQFDPRREPLRFAPALAAMTVAVCVAGVTMGARADPEAPAKGAKPAAAAKANVKSGKTEVKPDKATGKQAAAKDAATKPDPKIKPAKLAAADKPGQGEPEQAEEKAEPKAKTARAKTAEKSSGAKSPAAKQPTYGAAQTIKVKLRRTETLEAAIRRAEAAPDEAKAAAAKVDKALGAPTRPGQLFTVEVAPRDGRVGVGRLMKLTMKVAGEDPVVVTRGDEGAMTLAARAKPKAGDKAETRLAKADEGDPAAKSSPKAERARLVAGEVRGSLYGSAKRVGVSGGQIGEIVKVFAAKLDFQRDLKVGDPFAVVYDDKGQLIYARIKTKGSYRFARSGGQVLWLDENGKSLKSGLLRTPVDGARMSSRFGMRRHPILGYQRMHQGIDFAAASGTPIMAAGDGVVTRVGRWGGYGNWLQIKHSGGYESGYAHLSRYASGLKVGDKVKQGELVAYVGSTGASTGPHLHHEIWLNGKRVDPKGARIPTGFALEGRELVAFHAQRDTVRAALNRADTKLVAGKGRKVAGLRPARDADSAA